MTKLKVDFPLKTLDGLRDPSAGEDGILHDKACPRCRGTGNLPVTDPDHETATNKKVTLRRLIVNSLMNVDQTKLTGEEKLKHGLLAQRVFMLSTGAEIELESGDIQLIKKQIGKSYNSLVVLQAWPLLEGKVTGNGTGT